MKIIIELSMAQLKALQHAANKEFGFYQDNHYRASLQNLPEHKSYIETLKGGLVFWQEVIDVLTDKDTPS